MRQLAPIPVNLVRTLALSLVFAAGTLWGIEKIAASFQLEVVGDPLVPSGPGIGHPYLLWELPPGEAEVNGQRITVNSLGARGPEVRIDQSSDIRRVISLGGDVAFGAGVERSETYSVDAVSSLGGQRVGVETILLSVPDYTIEQIRNLMDMRGWSLAPDLLVLSGPSHEMEVAPYEDNAIISSFENKAGLSEALGESAVYRILDHWIRVTSGPRARRRGEVFTQGMNLNTLGLPRVGINRYAQSLDALVTKAGQRRVDVVFVLLPLPADLTNSHVDDRVKLYREALALVASRHGIPVVDGPTLFAESDRKEAELFRDEQTLTKRGHRILSYALARVLRPWMRGRKLNKKGTGADLPIFKEPELGGTE